MTFKPSSELRQKVEMEFHGETLTLESGWLAKQAGGSVLATCGETVLLATVCSADPRPGMDFFPMVVEYQEKSYSAGKIPGGFFKREGRPQGDQILTCRLIDRPIRPLFPDGYKNEVQIIVSVLSSDGRNSTDTLAICAASAALHISELPFDGPIAAVRVGKHNGEMVINPPMSDQEALEMDVIVAAKSDAVMMVEGSAKQVSEKELLDGLYLGHEELKKIVALQEELRAKVGKEKVPFIAPEKDEALEGKIAAIVGDRIKDAMQIHDKASRKEAIKAVEAEVYEQLEEEYPEGKGDIKEFLYVYGKKVARNKTVGDQIRIDGRKPDQVRPIECEVSVLPRVHGTGLFTRGQTQALVSTTLGTGKDAQRVDKLHDTEDKHFMLHYNFPPFCTGEAKMMRGTSRREVGHGNLAHRAIAAVLPTQEEFPYVIRIVSEVLESNGSSSMASVCGGSMSLMNAGVPIKAPVAGVAMGLIKEGDGVAILTDILGDEDHFGDMDFKVCGSAEGVTAIQMDIKCDGLTREIMETALAQARDARLHILDCMSKAIDAPASDLSKYSPRITTIKINPAKIRDLIGPGGKVIQSITKETGVSIDIQDDGTVKVASSDEESKNRALQLIEGITEEAEVGKLYQGVVKRITDFGAFVEILPGTDGLVHISQLAHERVEKVEDIVKEGDEVKVRVIEIDRQGRVRLSRKDALEADA